VSQTRAEKMAAIESLLEFLFVYRDDIPGAARTQRQEWISEPSPLDPPPLAPRAYNLACNGRCWTCRAFYASLGKRPDCPPNDKWWRDADKLRAKYRIGDIEESLFRLSGENPTTAQAVWAVHVEPWPDPKTEPIAASVRKERDQLAREGVAWMAHDIRGDVLAYGEKPDPTENQIRQLASQGYTQRRIAKELRCDHNKVAAVLRGVDVRCG
jgi:hypothetical protein